MQSYRVFAELHSVQMQCLGYRDTTTIRVGFPGKTDNLMLDAVASYMKRRDLSKDKELTQKKKPFLHSFQVEGGRLVVCVYRKKLTTDAITGGIRMVLFQAKTSHTINTNDSLGDICRAYAINGTPSTPKRDDKDNKEKGKKVVKLGLDGKPRQTKINTIRKDIDETTEIMKGNIVKLLDRGEKIEHLHTMTDDIEANTGAFAKQSNKLKCAKCKELCKWHCCLIMVCLVGILVLGGAITLGVLKFAKSK